MLRKVNRICSAVASSGRHRLRYFVATLVFLFLVYVLFSRIFLSHQTSGLNALPRAPADININLSQREKSSGRPREQPGFWGVDESLLNDTADVKHENPFKGPQNDRQRAVVAAFQHAWSNYAKYAWGHDELKPLTKGWIDWLHLGVSIVDSLDTMYIMGLDKEFSIAREWVVKNQTFDIDADIQLFEVVIRELGGFLSIYHLSGDRLFLAKAIELGNRLVPCFGSVTKIPCIRISLRAKNVQYSDISSAEIGTIQLELIDLTRSSHDNKFEKMAMVVSTKLHEMTGKVDALVPNFINANTGRFRRSEVTVGASGDSYYEYLLKQWIQTGKKVDWLKNDYLMAVESIKKHLLRYTHPSRFAFVGSLGNADSKHFRSEMEHLACFLPGTLALGTMHGLDPSHLEIAANLTRTCYEMYASQPTGLSPEIAGMNMDPNGAKDIYILFNNRHNVQRPETIESIYYMYRATRDPMYREWGWKIFEAFEKNSKVENGYASIENVDATKTIIHRDKMESFFLAETLKYFYLLFSDTDLLPLSRYVFNTEAHPLPIYTRLLAVFRTECSYELHVANDGLKTVVHQTDRLRCKVRRLARPQLFSFKQIANILSAFLHRTPNRNSTASV